MAVIGSLAVNIVAKTDELQKGLRRSQKHVKDFDRGIGASIGTLRKWHGALLAASGALGLGFMVRQQLRAIDELGKFSDRIGISTEKLAGLHHAAELSGVATNQLNMGLQRMTRRVAEAARGSGEAVSALNELGISAVSLARLTPDKQLSSLADALNRVEAESDRVRLAFKLFDSEGVALLQMTQNGSKGLAAMSDEAERLGKAIDRIDVKKVEELNDQWTRLSSAGEGLSRKAITTFAPPLTKWLEFLQSEIDHMSRGPAAILEGLREGNRGRGRGFSIGAFERGWRRVARGGEMGQAQLDRIAQIQERMGRLESVDKRGPFGLLRDWATKVGVPMDKLGGKVDRLTAATTKSWQAFASFPEKVGTMNPLEAAIRQWWAEQERLQKLRGRAFDFSGFQSFMRFGRDLAFRPQQFGTPSMNAALEAGTREAYIAQRSGGRQEFLKEVAKLQKDEVNISKEIASGIKTLIDQGKAAAGQVFSIPH